MTMVDTGQYLDVKELRAGIWGQIKTAKSTFAFSFPKPLVHLDIDQSAIRAIHRYKSYKVYWAPVFSPLSATLDAVKNDPPDIIIQPYQMPVRWPGTSIQGMLEMWDALTTDVLTVYATPWVKSLSVDTGTMVWKIATAAHLQRVQEKSPGRQNLSQIEYARPNTELRGLYGGATTFHKNLCITHHVGGVYEDKLTPQGVQQMRVGDTWDGFSGMGSLVDLVGMTYIERTSGQPSIPSLRVDSSGYTLQMEGLSMPNPTFDGLLEEINRFRREEAGL